MKYNILVYVFSSQVDIIQRFLGWLVEFIVRFLFRTEVQQFFSCPN